MVSGRIPFYVKDYCRKNHISISELMMKGFEVLKENEYSYNMDKMREYEEKVLHYRQKVLNIDTEINTKVLKCNTIRETFLQLGRGNQDYIDIQRDKNWLKPKVQQLQSEGIGITLDDLYTICITPTKKSPK